MLALTFKDITHKSFTSNGTFNIPQGLKNVCVNVVGGTGHNKAYYTGTPSSFGKYITATGGGGNVGGNGQFGNSRFGYITLGNETSVNVSVGAGGSVDIFYTEPLTQPQNNTQAQP